jgi:hypothetical protein
MKGKYHVLAATAISGLAVAGAALGATKAVFPGTPGPDTIYGTPAADVINGRAGNDRPARPCR